MPKTGETVVSPEKQTSNDPNDIFKTLSEELDFGKKSTNNKKRKGTVFYIQYIISSLFFVQLFLVIGIVVFLGFAHIQKNPEYSNKNFLDPICPLIL